MLYSRSYLFCFVFFFFQAEDGIRDKLVTGVQTCALPISRQNGMSYGTFMHGLKLAGIELDRKVLADIAVRDPETFRRFAESAREASAEIGRASCRERV